MAGRFSNRWLYVLAFFLLGAGPLIGVAGLLHVLLQKPTGSSLAVVMAACYLHGALIGGLLHACKGRIVAINWDEDGLEVTLGMIKRVRHRFSWESVTGVDLFLGHTRKGRHVPFAVKVHFPDCRLSLDAMQVFWSPVQPLVTELRARSEVVERPLDLRYMDGASLQWT